MTSRPSRRTAVAAAALALSVSALLGCTTAAQPAEVPVLRLGPLSTQNSLTMAASSGRLADAVEAAGGRLEVTAGFPAFAPAAEALAAGQVDLTTGSSTAIVPALAAGRDLVVVAVEHNDDDT